MPDRQVFNLDSLLEIEKSRASVTLVRWMVRQSSPHAQKIVHRKLADSLRGQIILARARFDNGVGMTYFRCPLDEPSPYLLESPHFTLLE